MLGRLGSSYKGKTLFLLEHNLSFKSTCRAHFDRTLVPKNNWKLQNVTSINGSVCAPSLRSSVPASATPLIVFDAVI